MRADRKCIEREKEKTTDGASIACAMKREREKGFLSKKVVIKTWRQGTRGQLCSHGLIRKQGGKRTAKRVTPGCV